MMGEIEHGNQPSAWEKEKFEREVALREAEVEIERGKLGAERRRSILAGVLVPVSLAVITAVPALINNQQERLMQQASFEASLVMEAIKAEPDQAAENLSFLVEVGLISMQAYPIQRFLEQRLPGSGPSPGG